MELQDYISALRQYWRTWVALTVIGVLAALLVVEASPKTYRATAQVFVASTLEGTSGAQFINQRVGSYPDIAESLAVLGPVAEEMELDDSFEDLRGIVTATNPAETSQVNVSATTGSPEEAARIANAVAERFSETVETLEAPADGRSPVDLTVTDPATVPTSPASPDAVLLVALGLVVGLLLGLALAILRSRLGTTLSTETDVRELWGADGERIEVYAARSRGRSRTGRPAARLAGQLELMAESRPVRVFALSASPDRSTAPRRLLRDIADVLAARGVPAGVVRASVEERLPTSQQPRVQLATGRRPVALREWRQLLQNYDAVVIVVELGHGTVEELRELRAMAAAAGVQPLAVLLVRGRGFAVTSGATIRTRADRFGASTTLDLPAKSTTGAPGGSSSQEDAASGEPVPVGAPSGLRKRPAR
ncbi:YveK family protein [Candidatus Blastococcus massiliensis]|uniref:YveK family protein n=1 Tax=Candidatus Blastococcus massiliensis TaxID=1470358 RepID=UPI0004BCF723|nr:Wzz/FepE/Etk N-terminal domain-containing protein [Candidatus Blastococcus massiliensis]